MERPQEAIQYLINHLVMPPTLPNASDTTPRSNHVLLELVIEALAQLSSMRRNEPAWTQLLKAFRLVQEFENNKSDFEPKLMEALSNLGSERQLILHIEKQNVCVILQRKEGGVLFQLFEAAPRVKDIMTASGRLISSYPARAFLVPRDAFDDAGFQIELAQFLSQLAVTQTGDAAQKVYKGNTLLSESRDSPTPRLVTELMTAILSPFATDTQIVSVEKRLRDNVRWHNAERPWRRSPLWLVIKAASQLFLQNDSAIDDPRAAYKNLIVFIVSKLARKAHEAVQSPHLLVALNARLARKSMKLNDRLFDDIASHVEISVQQLTKRLSEEWNNIQQHSGLNIPLIQTASQRDIENSLPSSRNYIANAISNAHGKRTMAKGGLVLDSPPHVLLTADQLPRAGIFATEIYDPLRVISSFEAWVETNIWDWTPRQAPSTNICSDLHELIEAYHGYAMGLYKDIPEQLSQMFLVLLELWIALESVVIRLLPLLAEYDPEISPEFLRPLLVPRARDMARLDKIDTYLRDRKPVRSFTAATPLFGTITPSSFQVVSYDRNFEAYDKVKKEIETSAQRARDRKRDQLEASMARWHALFREARQLIHLHRIDDKGREYHAKRSCRKCELEQHRENMTIDLHEWPLPENDVLAKALIFELRCPPAFGIFRDCTWFIVHQLGRSQSNKSNQVQELMKTSALARYAQNMDHRITMASYTKSITKMHYSAVSLPVYNPEELFVTSNLRWSLIDTQSEVWTAEQKADPSVKQSCTFTLPKSSCNGLQRSLRSCKHSQNELIASQSLCPEDMNFHEYIQFGSLRAGERLQMLNLLRELGSAELQINKMAFKTLVLQTIWEAGTWRADEPLREPYTLFGDPAFCMRFLDMLQQNFHSIETNWKELIAMDVIVFLTLRFVALAKEESFIRDGVDLLRKMRHATISWARDLTKRRHDILGFEGVRESQDRLLRACFACRSTYAIDDNLTALHMLNTETDVSIYVECAILIHDNLPQDVSSLSPDLRRTCMRDKKLAISLLDWQRGLVHDQHHGFMLGITGAWEGSQLAQDWEPVGGECACWIRTSTIAQSMGTSQVVHYNLLTGELLVDGKRLGTLPAAYTTNPLYVSIFASRILEVVASDIPDLIYKTSKPIKGHYVYLALVDSELIIRARTLDTVFHLVPRQILSHDLPISLVDDYFHWLDLNRRHIEFRSQSGPWDRAEKLSKNWLIRYANGTDISHSSAHVHLGPHYMIDRDSSFSKSIYEVFRRIEVRGHIHIARKHLSGVTEIKLPRYRLHFSVLENGLLKCHEFNSIVDLDQSLGTLIGLESRLIFRTHEAHTHLVKRSVLIPHGRCNIDRSGNHVRVKVRMTQERNIRYENFEIDTRLQQLRSRSGSDAMLFLAYLHAITSFILPDPFLSTSGTEHALHILREAAVWSSAPLSPLAKELLSYIKCLSPSRTFYAHSTLMERVVWDPVLNPLLQHEDFALLAEAIVGHSNRFNGLYKDQGLARLPKQTDLALNRRAKYQNALYYPNAAVEWDSTPHDVHYADRARALTNESQQAAFAVAGTIKQWPKELEVIADLHDHLKTYDIVLGFSEFFPTVHVSELLNISLQEHWGSLLHLCCTSRRECDTYKLSFLFGTIAFGQPQLLPDLRTILAFAFRSDLRSFTGELHGSYQLSEGHVPNPGRVSDLISANQRPFEGKGQQVPTDRAGLLRLEQYRNEVAEQTGALIKFIGDIWPNPLTLDSISDSYNFTCIDLEGFLEDLEDHYSSWQKNHLFWKFCCEASATLACLSKGCPSGKLKPLLVEKQTRQRRASMVPLFNLMDIVIQSKAPTLTDIVNELTQKTAPQEESTPDCEELRIIVAKHGDTGPPTYKDYAGDLNASIDGYRISQQLQNSDGVKSTELYLQLRQESSTHEEDHFRQICMALTPSSRAACVAQKAMCRPAVTPRSILCLLATERSFHLPTDWTLALVAYGQAILQHQRATRINLLLHRKDDLSQWKELKTKVMPAKFYQEFPDWLLIQIEHDFILRDVQIEVAEEMLNPSSGRNEVLQLNMGEGKSSVIIPLLATALANGSRLARIVVLKPLAKQMYQTLSSRIGGLVNRRIYVTPFHRRTPMTLELAEDLQTIYRQCRDTKGVMIVQPEHMLSLKLRGIERLYTNDLEVAGSLLRTQHWLHRNSSDVLDESDELLSVQFELVYTIGTQQNIEGQPDRWLIVQSIFTLLQKHVEKFRNDHPAAFETSPEVNGSFGTLRVLDITHGKKLLSGVVEEIISGHIPGVAFDHCPPEIRAHCFSFINNRDLPARLRKAIFVYFAETSQLQNLVLMRGLFSHNILLFALANKRWNVNYGLDLSRGLMSVPYRAKDVPSISSEWGHPDVAITLTCLSYYYSGLTSSQLKECFEKLSKIADPGLEYDKWQRKTSLPEPLRHLRGVNLEDKTSWDADIYPHLRCNKAVCDFYLSRVVFPREAKQFAHKLSTSAWDLPLTYRPGQARGFSGTNDNRFLLPLSIEQADLPSLHGTSALVLNTLLRTENRMYIEANAGDGQRLSTLKLVELIAKQPRTVRCLIDCGAQATGMSNKEVIERWRQRMDAEAGVYLDEADELVVLDGRTGMVERLVSSPYKDQLDRCVLYIDDVHCRGIDVQLPDKFRAAVTLGPDVHKDKFVQACMRLRKLGHGQSILTIAPPEVHRAILSVNALDTDAQLDVSHVIRWLMYQSCEYIDRSLSLWAYKGISFTRRRLAYEKIKYKGSEMEKFAKDTDERRLYLATVQEREAKTVEEMYASKSESAQRLPLDILQSEDKQAQKLIETWRKMDNAALKETSYHTEAEREIEHELEVEQQVERPRSQKALFPNLRREVTQFVSTGTMSMKNLSKAFVPAFDIFTNTSAKVHLHGQRINSGLWITTEFARTIELVKDEVSDMFLRPVHWVLTSAKEDKVVLISHHEANELLPMIRQSAFMTLHVFAPRVAKQARSFRKLDFFSIPTRKRKEIEAFARCLPALNLFAGSLYFDTFEEYQDLCKFLGVVGSGISLKDNAIPSGEGFVDPVDRMAVQWESPFHQSPLPFVKVLLNMRRKGQNFLLSHMGHIVSGRVLKKEDFD